MTQGVALFSPRHAPAPAELEARAASVAPGAAGTLLLDAVGNLEVLALALARRAREPGPQVQAVHIADPHCSDASARAVAELTGLPVTTPTRGEPYVPQLLAADAAPDPLWRLGLLRARLALAGTVRLLGADGPAMPAMRSAAMPPDETQATLRRYGAGAVWLTPAAPASGAQAEPVPEAGEAAGAVRAAPPAAEPDAHFIVRAEGGPIDTRQSAERLRRKEQGFTEADKRALLQAVRAMYDDPAKCQGCDRDVLAWYLRFFEPRAEVLALRAAMQEEGVLPEEEEVLLDAADYLDYMAGGEPPDWPERRKVLGISSYRAATVQLQVDTMSVFGAWYGVDIGSIPNDHPGAWLDEAA